MFVAQDRVGRWRPGEGAAGGCGRSTGSARAGAPWAWCHWSSILRLAWLSLRHGRPSAAAGWASPAERAGRQGPEPERARPRRPRCRIFAITPFLELRSPKNVAWAFFRPREDQQPLVDIRAGEPSAASGWFGLHARYCAVGPFPVPVAGPRRAVRRGLVDDGSACGIGWI